MTGLGVEVAIGAGSACQMSIPFQRDDRLGPNTPALLTAAAAWDLCNLAGYLEELGNEVLRPVPREGSTAHGHRPFRASNRPSV